MKNRLIAILAIALGVLIAVGIFKQHEITKYKKENSRLSSNQESLLSNLRTYQVRVGSESLNVAQVKALQLELKEVKKYRSSDAELIKELGIKLKYAQAVVKSASKTENTFEAPVRDSIVYLPSGVDTIRYIRYSDRWFSFEGSLDRSNNFTGRAESVDTIVGIPNIIPKRFLFFRYGVKAVQFTATNKNPHCKIFFQEYYEIKK